MNTHYVLREGTIQTGQPVCPRGAVATQAVTGLWVWGCPTCGSTLPQQQWRAADIQRAGQGGLRGCMEEAKQSWAQQGEGWGVPGKGTYGEAGQGFVLGWLSVPPDSYAEALPPV